jgi:hypothetical protein
MYAARTLVYLDCMRDARVDIGPHLREELAQTLPAVLAGSRWYCGRVYEALCELVNQVAQRAGNGPLGPVLGQTMGALFAGPPQVREFNAELQQRWAGLLADPDVTTLVARAEATFADHVPGWPMSVSHSPDVQVAAPSAAAVDAGRFLCVVGDFHPGTNTLVQGLFATRHPDREAFLDALVSDWGEGPWLIPPKSAERMRSRIMPAMTRPHRIHVAASPGACMPDGYRVVDVRDLLIHDLMITDRNGAPLGAVTDLLEVAMFVAGVQAYNPFPVEEHAPRLTLSRTVLRRETWQVPSRDTPKRPEDAAAWARDRGMPRKVFMLSPLENKPVYVDFESRVLTAIACRQFRRAAAERPDDVVRFTELLPGPEDCWLEDGAGLRYTSELRMVAVDLSRAAGA